MKLGGQPTLLETLGLLSIEKRAGKSGRYFIVLNCDSEYGLSSETCGRECVFVIPRSASRNATAFDFIDEPRSAWIVAPRAIEWVV